MERIPIHRRNYFPEPRFQMRFLTFLVAGSVIQILATVFILYYFLSQNYLFLVKYAGLDTQITQLLSHELRVLIAVIGLTFAIYLVGTVVLGVLFSHRIAGVIYALKRTIHAIEEGQDVKLNLREKDEFQDLVNAFNAMVERLKSQGSVRRYP